jgi:hypothetical protein
MIIVRGSTGATEEWSNTWCVINPGDTAAWQDVLDVFHDFYAALFTGAGLIYNGSASASQARYINLPGGFDRPVTWDSLVGGGLDDALPSEVALRVSVRAPNNRHGGPFLPAPGRSVLSSTGLLGGGASSDIVAALQDLVDGLDALGCALGLNSPGDEELHEVVGVKLGQVFDAIRSRRQDLAEAYVAVTLP